MHALSAVPARPSSPRQVPGMGAMKSQSTLETWIVSWVFLLIVNTQMTFTLGNWLSSSSSDSNPIGLPKNKSSSGWLSTNLISFQSMPSRMYSSCSCLKTCCKKGNSFVNYQQVPCQSCLNTLWKMGKIKIQNEALIVFWSIKMSTLSNLVNFLKIGYPFNLTRLSKDSVPQLAQILFTIS